MRPFTAAIITIVLITLCALIAPTKNKKESEAIKKIHTDKYTVFSKSHLAEKDY